MLSITDEMTRFMAMELILDQLWPRLTLFFNVKQDLAIDSIIVLTAPYAIFTECAYPTTWYFGPNSFCVTVNRFFPYL